MQVILLYVCFFLEMHESLFMNSRSKISLKYILRQVDGLKVNMGSYYRGLLVAGQGTFVVLRFSFGLVLRLAWNNG